MSVEVLKRNITMGTGEGPHWEQSTQSLLFVDIVTQHVRRWDYASGEILKEIKLNSSIGFVIPRKTGGVVVGLGKRAEGLNISPQSLQAKIDIYFTDSSIGFVIPRKTGGVVVGLGKRAEGLNISPQSLQAKIDIYFTDSSIGFVIPRKTGGVVVGLGKRAEGLNISPQSLQAKIDIYFTDSSIGFVIPRKTGGVVVGLGNSVSHLDMETEKVTTLIQLDKGLETRMNDAKCDSRGRLWAGTMGIDRWPDLPHMGEGSFYCVDTDGSVKKHKEKTNISNGLAWSSDEKTMYYIDSIPGILWAYDYDINAGSISNMRTVLDFDEERFGSPDGMTIDTEGKLWVACYNGSCVLRLDPNTGEELQIIKLPAKRITSCCFGGPNYDELFVTSAAAGASKEELEEFPLSGSLFKVTGLGVKGYPPNIYHG